eukprot:TRINITY_DN10528_c0_g1_i6.p1 TRINITY_DN10528_c0_g1~~TRINITY_DN10528_c0_g1_i6.p1  ORF type:complete len:403 (+),score=150.80 TRINITY_DN10528_c0_g1_i6:83-1291(+)
MVDAAQPAPVKMHRHDPYLVDAVDEVVQPPSTPSPPPSAPDSSSSGRPQVVIVGAGQLEEPPQPQQWESMQARVVSPPLSAQPLSPYSLGSSRTDQPQPLQPLAVVLPRSPVEWAPPMTPAEWLPQPLQPLSAAPQPLQPLNGLPPAARAAAPAQPDPPPLPPTQPRQHDRRNASRPPSQKTQYAGRGGRKLFVGQLPRETTAEELKALMSPFGSVEELHTIKDRQSGRGTGAAFVVFRHRDSALAAISHFDGKVRLEGVDRPMHVRLAEGEVPADSDVKLFVGHLPTTATESTLDPHFRPFGGLLEIAVIRKAGKSRGCAFVRYSSRQAAAQCISGLHGRLLLEGSQMPVTVRHANTEADKRQRRSQAQGEHRQHPEGQPECTREPPQRRAPHQSHAWAAP